jgi:hypothetical protein
MYTEEQILRARAIGRYFREDMECERLIKIKREAPDVFARIPEAHRRKIEPYLERKEAHELLKRAGVEAAR